MSAAIDIAAEHHASPIPRPTVTSKDRRWAANPNWRSATTNVFTSLSTRTGRRIFVLQTGLAPHYANREWRSIGSSHGPNR